MATKNCFIDKARPCDLTCKAAVVVDDAVEPVDCQFLLAAAQLEGGFFDLRSWFEGRFGGAGDGAGPMGFPDPGGPPPGPGTGGSDVSSN